MVSTSVTCATFSDCGSDFCLFSTDDCGVAVRIKYSFMDVTVLEVSSHNHKWGT